MALEVNGLRNDLAEAIYGVPLDRIQQEIHSGGGGGWRDCILPAKGYTQTKNECRVGRKHKYRSLRILEWRKQEEV